MTLNTNKLELDPLDPSVLMHGIGSNLLIFLDLDLPFKESVRICKKLCAKFHLQGWRLMITSLDHHHAIFCVRASSREELLIIRNWAIRFSDFNLNVTKWAVLQGCDLRAILRVGIKGANPMKGVVEIAAYEGSQGGMITVYLKHRQQILSIETALRQSGIPSFDEAQKIAASVVQSYKRSKEVMAQ